MRRKCAECSVEGKENDKEIKNGTVSQSPSWDEEKIVNRSSLSATRIFRQGRGTAISLPLASRINRPLLLGNVSRHRSLRGNTPRCRLTVLHRKCVLDRRRESSRELPVENTVSSPARAASTLVERSGRPSHHRLRYSLEICKARAIERSFPASGLGWNSCFGAGKLSAEIFQRERGEGVFFCHATNVPSTIANFYTTNLHIVI